MGLSGTQYTDRRTNGNSNVFIIATSSKPNDIDQAMRRPGEGGTVDCTYCML